MENLQQKLEQHKLWIDSNREKGTRLDLSNADLRNANLSGINLSYANLYGADLSDASLSDANLRNADLSEADLSEADLRYADLREVKGYRILTFGGIGSEKRTTTYICEIDRVFCGCFSGNIQEFEEKVRETHANNAKYLNEYLTAIDFIKKLQTIN